MKLDFEYGQGTMSANLPDNTDIFIPGETVPDPECLPQDWDTLYAETIKSIRNPIGMQTLTEALMNSCNVAMMQIVQKVGMARFYEFYKAFGLLDQTGIDLPGESRGQFHNTSETSDWNEVALATASFGQRFTVTPMQMITMVSAIVDDGKLKKPYVVKNVLNADGTIKSTTDPEVLRQVISEDTSAYMREAMEQCRRLGKILAAHCEDNSLLRGGYIHDGAYAKTHSHRGICSESEWGQIARDVRLAEETGCAYHVCHVSTKESVSIIREAKRRGVNVTCETGPHYLTFTEDDLQEDGRFKMNPPLRSREDRDALIEGLLDGTIDMIVTDHAPHSREEKARGLEKSAMGVVGLETSFAACYTSFVKPGVLPLGKLMDLMHDAPMRRFGCGTEIAVGQPADLTVFDLNETYTVDPEKFLTMGRATPFTGTQLTGACKLTMIGGEIVWKEDTL